MNRLSPKTFIILQIDFYMKYTGKDKKYIQDKLLPATDVWMSAETAKKHGVIDKVIK